MDWTQPIDAYCERVGQGFWAEPLNAVSNAAFLGAAVFGILLWLKKGGDDRSGAGASEAVDAAPGLALSFGRGSRSGVWLSILVAVIGVGSFLFHTFANRWSSLADVVPIAIFIQVYFGLALHRLVGLRAWLALASTAAFFLLSLLARPVFAPIVGSSAAYVPALLAMLGIGGLLATRRSHGTAGRTILAAAAVFAVSLGFRMVDAPLCPVWPLGTHFLWHVLNAVTLACLLMAMIGGPNREAGLHGRSGRPR